MILVSLRSADDLLRVRDVISGLAGMVCVRDEASPQTNYWRLPVGETDGPPLKFSAEEMTSELLPERVVDGQTLRDEGEFSYLLGDEFPAAVDDVHLEELEDFVAAIEANGLWVDRGDPTLLQDGGGSGVVSLRLHRRRNAHSLRRSGHLARALPLGTAGCDEWGKSPSPDAAAGPRFIPDRRFGPGCGAKTPTVVEFAEDTILDVIDDLWVAFAGLHLRSDYSRTPH